MPDEIIEWAAIESLYAAESLPWAPPIKDETPDFFCFHGNRKFGVEITEFHIVSPAPRTNRSKVIDEAQKLYISWGGTPIDVTVFFHDSAVFRPHEVLGQAEQLATFLLEEAPNAGYVRENYLTNTPDSVSAVSIRRTKYSTTCWYSGSELGFCVDAVESDIQKRLDAKRKSLAVARQRCDELWLVIVCDLYGKIGKVAELTDTAINASYTFDVDRVLWLYLHEKRVLEFARIPSISKG